MDNTDQALLPRFSAELVATALKDTPVVMVTGRANAARQHWYAIWLRVIANSSPWTTTRCWLRHAAIPGLVRALDRTTIDEVQRVPDLLRAIKKSLDEDRRAGRRGWWVIPASSFPVTSSRENLRMCNRCASNAHYSHFSVNLTFSV